VAVAIVTALIGVWLISIAAIGHFARPLGPPMRLAFLALGVAALMPADLFPGGVLVDTVGVLGGVALLGYELMLARRDRAAALPRPAE
jgi:TRAP-type uncharacterized transport system fused permease subunit